MPTNRTDISISTPRIDDEPTVYLNTGSVSGPFAAVTLSPEMWLYIREATHARAIAAAFTKAADLLDAQEAMKAQEPARDVPDRGAAEVAL